MLPRYRIELSVDDYPYMLKKVKNTNAFMTCEIYAKYPNNKLI